jgi:hypothetical protein
VAELQVPQVNFGILGDLMNTYKDARKDSARQQAMRQLQGGGTPQNAIAQLIGAGDIQGASALAHIMSQSPEHAGAIAEAQAKVAERYKPKTANIKRPGGEEVTVQAGSGGYEIPKIAGLPDETPGGAIPAGADPKTYRQEVAKRSVANDEDAVKGAAAASDLKPLIDKAAAAYEAAHKAGAIGPYAGNAYGRAINKYTLQTNAEKLRQDYDTAINNIQVRIAAAQNRGEGQVSNFERSMYKAQFPGLDALDPAGQLSYLKQLQSNTNQTIAAGRSSRFAGQPTVQPRINAPSQFGPQGGAPQTAAAPVQGGGQGGPPMQGARQAPDGNWYVEDPNRPGKYLQVR